MVRLAADMELLTSALQINGVVDDSSKQTKATKQEEISGSHENDKDSGASKKTIDLELSHCIRCLLEVGYDPNRAVGNIGPAGHPLGLALKSGLYECARVLLEFNADIRRLGIQDLASIRYDKCPEDILEQLQEKGALRQGRCIRLCLSCSLCLACGSSCLFVCLPWDAIALSDQQGSLTDMFRSIANEAIKAREADGY